MSSVDTMLPILINTLTKQFLGIVIYFPDFPSMSLFIATICPVQWLPCTCTSL